MGQVMETRPPRSPVLLFLTAKPGNEAAASPRPHPHHTSKSAYMTKKFLSVSFSEFTYANKQNRHIHVLWAILQSVR